MKGKMRKSTWPGGPGGCCKETGDVKGQDVIGKVMAGDGCGLGAPRGGSYGSSSWVFSTSVLLACCPLLGFMSSRSKVKGRRAFQQKCPINQDLLPPAEVQHGGHLPLPLPGNHDFLTQRTVHLSSHFAKPWSPMLISFGRAPAPGATSAAAGPRDSSDPKLPIPGKDWPAPCNLK